MILGVQSMSNRLVLCGDGATFQLKDEGCHHFIYCFGFASSQGENYTLINDPAKLNQVGDALRQELADWVFSFNKSFLSNGLTLENLSLFFLTDLSYAWVIIQCNSECTRRLQI